MEKYIRTFYNDEKVIMKLSGCEVCPLMRFHKNEDSCTCRYFTDKYNDNLIDPFVINSTLQGIVNEKIKIPEWCGLSNNLLDLAFNKTTYRAFVSSILVDNNDNCDDSLLPFIDVEKLKLEDNKKLDNFLIQLIDNKVNFDYDCDMNDNFSHSESGLCIKHHSDFDKIVKHQNNYKHQTVVKKQEICSLCGEDDESVKRTVNNGMCSECWKLYENDEDKKKQAFINNFRMKRNKNFPKESFKLISNIII